MLRDLIPRATAIFAPMAMKVAAAIIVALLAALAIAIWRADSLSDARDDALQRVGAERMAHDVTRASYAVLRDDLDRMVREGKLTAERRDKALAEAIDAGDELREQAARVEAGEVDYREVEGL